MDERTFLVDVSNTLENSDLMRYWYFRLKVRVST